MMMTISLTTFSTISKRKKELSPQSLNQSKTTRLDLNMPQAKALAFSSVSSLQSLKTQETHGQSGRSLMIWKTLATTLLKMPGPRRAVPLRALLKRGKLFSGSVGAAHHQSLASNQDPKLLIETMMINQMKMKDPTRNRLVVESVQDLINGL